MDVFVGTSGWYYDWNREKSLDWFIKNSGLNTVELNASFYRFPFPNQVKSWARKGSPLAWSIKVHRSVTHTRKFNLQAEEILTRFLDAFSPLDSLIGHYLFQAPPSFEDVDRVCGFSDRSGLGGRFALECRNKTLLGDDHRCRILQEHALLVSVDSPDFRNRIFSGDTIYLRMHGRTAWYRHNYTKEELAETAAIIRNISPDQVFVYFNNNHHMLENAQMMFELLWR